MAESLVIIEAPGKRAGLSDVLWRAGMRGFEVLATAGHIATNPTRLTPLCITSSFRETGYAIREDRRAACERIREAAQNTPTRVLGLHLGRTEDAVRSRAGELGVSLKPTNQSPYGTRGKKR